jgi:hypothetical protein
MPAISAFSYDVFLSYSANDKPRVRRLAKRLLDAGLRVWFDDWVIQVGDDIFLAIQRGLEAARVQVLCLSPDALTSDWVTLEGNTVLFRDPTNAGRRFIPLLLVDCQLPDTLKRFKRVDFRQETPAAFDELLAACRSATESAPPAPRVGERSTNRRKISLTNSTSRGDSTRPGQALDTRSTLQIPVPLLDAIANGKCLPVVGAGFSRNCTLPPNHVMPLWDELTGLLGKALGASYSKPELAAAAYCLAKSKPQLALLLRNLLHVNRAMPGKAHLAFARLPFKTVITTNFDFLLEDAFKAVKKPCFPVVCQALIDWGAVDGETRVLKIHGDVYHPHDLVITEDDYDRFVERHPPLVALLKSLIADHTLLFLGFSVNDPDFRQIWRAVKDDFSDRLPTSYTFAVRPDHETMTACQTRGIRLVELPGTRAEYPSLFTKVFEVIGQYSTNQK